MIHLGLYVQQHLMGGLSFRSLKKNKHQQSIVYLRCYSHATQEIFAYSRQNILYRQRQDFTFVFSSTTPLDETDNEQDENQQSDGTHEPDKPALSSDVFRLLVGYEPANKHTEESGRKRKRYKINV